MSLPQTSPVSVPVADQQRARFAIGLIGVTFFLGLLISAFYFFPGRTFDWKDAIISDLQSPEENPRGYLASALATALTAFFFLELLRIFHRWMRVVSVPGARTGSAFFGLGAGGALAIGCLAPFPVSYESVHIPLAFATFICLVTGIGVYLLLASWQLRPVSQCRSHCLLLCCGLVLAILAALVKIYLTPDFFTDENLLTTLALWEWLLCASIIGFLLVLAGTLGHQPAGARASGSQE